MPKITTKDSTRIYYNDGGKGQPIVFSHGWPLSGDVWERQMMFFSENGYRVIAHDRRGHGRSDQTWNNNTMDRFADDLGSLIEQLDLRDIILVGHSTGGGEVTRYIGRHGTSRVAKLVLLNAVPPLLLKSEKNPTGIPKEFFDQVREGIAGNRSQYLRDISMPFYGFNRKGAKVSDGLRDAFWLQAMLGSVKSQYDSIKQFSEVDFTDDLKKIDVPTLIVHGDDDQVVPIALGALRSSKLVQNAELKIYPGASHGLAQTHAEQFNADLLRFFRLAHAKKAA